MRRALPLLLVLLLSLPVALACSHGRFDPLNRGGAYDEAQKRFTRSLRWNQIAMASELVDPEHREEFLSHADLFQSLRFSDYEILTEDIDTDWSTATVDVMFHAYTLSSMLERSIRVHQAWYRDEETGRWWVRPEVTTGDAPQAIAP